MIDRRIPLVLAGGVAGSLAIALSSPAVATSPRASSERPPVTPSLPKVPVMRGGGGAVSSVDAVASQAGIDVLKAGGNAADAAVATAAALGVTEPYSTGIGGGGFFLYYDARSGQVRTIDGCFLTETASTENS